MFELNEEQIKLVSGGYNEENYPPSTGGGTSTSEENYPPSTGGGTSTSEESYYR